MLVAVLLLLLATAHVVAVAGEDSSSSGGNHHGQCIEKEKEALLSFKRVVDPGNILSSWTNDRTNQNCCTWRGVTCDNQTDHVVTPFWPQNFLIYIVIIHELCNYLMTFLSQAAKKNKSLQNIEFGNYGQEEDYEFSTYTVNYQNLCNHCINDHFFFIYY
ncbi:LOW QUALITY PROTEIN: LRR domain containing protein [Trema orientale]|uniref:LRR domain containing protein n=1 Tax=Trema orientale TaxID=63057 RepID=A0A2P5DX28_TREOI|nr:LOW QUALITY PROTEIN: LRR domain containing protein [Trema orientale]